MILNFVKGKEKNLLVIGVLVFIAGVTKLVGFIRNAVLAYYFGTSHSADVFNLLLYPTELILSFVVNNTIITALTSFYGRSDIEKDKVFWKVVHFYEAALVIVAIIIVILMSFTYSGINPMYLIVGASAAVLYGIAGIIQSFLNYKLKFYSSAIQDLVAQVILIAGIIGAHYWGVGSFAFFMLAAGIIRILIQVPDLLKTLDIKNIWEKILPSAIPFDKEIMKYILPLVFSFFLSNIPSFIILAQLQRTGNGYIAAYNYAVKIITLFNPIVIIPFTTYVIPKLQNMLEKSEEKIVNRIHTIALSIITIASIAAAAIFWNFSTPIAKLLYFRGSFGGDALALTSTMLQWLSFTVIGYAVMYYLLQLVLMHKQNRLVLICYIVGTTVAVFILFLNIEPIQTRVAMSLVFGTLTSIAILLTDALKRISK